MPLNVTRHALERIRGRVFKRRSVERGRVIGFLREFLEKARYLRFLEERGLVLVSDGEKTCVLRILKLKPSGEVKEEVEKLPPEEEVLLVTGEGERRVKVSRVLPTLGRFKYALYKKEANVLVLSSVDKCLLCLTFRPRRRSDLKEAVEIVKGEQGVKLKCEVG